METVDLQRESAEKKFAELLDQQRVIHVRGTPLIGEDHTLCQFLCSYLEARG